jgi:hypothetical protein
MLIVLFHKMKQTTNSKKNLKDFNSLKYTIDNKSLNLPSMIKLMTLFRNYFKDIVKQYLFMELKSLKKIKY